MNTEADTCRKFVVPRLQTAGWEGAPHAINEQRTFTDGRVIFVGGKAMRGRQKRADYILRYRADYPDYACRMTADEGDIGKSKLSSFQDVETKVPVILTMSQLLTTGVNAPTCKNVVLSRRRSAS